jgi:hypothetical protein
MLEKRMNLETAVDTINADEGRIKSDLLFRGKFTYWVKALRDNNSFLIRPYQKFIRFFSVNMLFLDEKEKAA